ncbi:hypothetical protein [Flavobacterium magnum]|uniref:hypothetical protein n=1 Tax=Flavobacterium magnum TaxID=2162713 RepID=UPI0011B208F7|nr:hypothetical protein [Flavobacterium magnum]
MKNLFLFLFLFILSISNYGQDTILHLNEVRINHTALKKEKKITVKKGFNSEAWLKSANDYYNYYYFDKIEFPMGRPLELYLSFQGTWCDNTTKWSPLESMTFEIDLYSVNDDGGIGERINQTPWVLNLPESKDAIHISNQQLSLKEYNLNANAFYLRFSTPNQQKCDTCFQYRAIGYRSKDSSEMRMKKESEPDEQNVPVPTRLSNGIEIRFKMDILTREY